MSLFRSNRINEISRKMLGNMKPSEILELVRDPQIKNSDVPKWVELVIEEYCTILVRRFEFYDARFVNRHGQLDSLIEKMTYYRTLWVNWDGLEPFPWREERPIKYYFDRNLVNRDRHYRVSN